MNQVTQLKQRWKPGSIIQIDLEDGTYAYGLVLDLPMIAFFNFLTNDQNYEISSHKFNEENIIFRFSVMKNCVTQYWPIIDKIKYDSKLDIYPDKWKKENDGYIIWKSNGQKVSATWEQCQSLECISVWECGAVEQRLRDHFAKRPCWYLENKKPDWEFIPIKKFYAQYGYDFTFLDDDDSTT